MPSSAIQLLLLACLPFLLVAMTVYDTRGELDPIHIPSPIFNKNIGKQLFDMIEGPIVYTRNFGLCNLPHDELVAFARNKIVLIDRYDGQFWEMGVGRQHAECLAKVGARAAIKAYHDIRDPGMGAHAYTRATENPEASIPLLHIHYNAIPKAFIDRIRSGDDTIMANLTADPNEWEELWGSDEFFGLWQIALPLLNFVGVVVGLAACGTLALHMREASKRKIKLSALKRSMRNSNMRLLMVSNAILTSTCLIRLFYCLSGPLYSSEDKSMNFHLILLDVTIVWESTASTTAIMIFHFWASFGMPQGERKLHTILGVLAVIAFPLYLGLTIVYAVRATRVGIITLVIKPALLASISGIVTVIYVYRVLQFLRQTTATTSRANQGHRKHIGVFMSIASATNVIAFFAVVVAELTPLGLTVKGRFASYTLLFFSLTIQAITQVVAFFPSLSVLQDEDRSSVQERCALAQEIRNKRQNAKRAGEGRSGWSVDKSSHCVNPRFHREDLVTTTSHTDSSPSHAEIQVLPNTGDLEVGRTCPPQRNIF